MTLVHVCSWTGSTGAIVLCKPEGFGTLLTDSRPTEGALVAVMLFCCCSGDHLLLAS